MKSDNNGILRYLLVFCPHTLFSQNLTLSSSSLS